MLSISDPMKGAGRGDYYLALAQEDYYARAIEEPGQWFGQGAEKLGLHGAVDRETFQNLLRGWSPDGGRALVQNADSPRRQSGWDLTFSAPKDMSVLWGLAPEDIRREVELIHQDAVQAALNYIEEVAGVTRRSPGGAVKEAAALIFATFQHGTSRAQDPHLHTHAVLINLGLRQDGTTGSLVSRVVFREKMTAGAIYQVTAAAGLRQRLGLTIVPERVGFHIRGVPKELRREFSKRRRQVEQALQERGHDSAVAAKIAALDTRPKKDHVPREVLFARWQQVGQAHGWGADQAAKLRRNAFPRPANKKKFEKRFQQAAAAIPQGKRARARVIQQAVKLATRHGTDVETMLRSLNKVRLRKRQPVVRIEWRPLFPKALKCNPAKRWKVPVVVIGKERNPQDGPRRWDEIVWRKNVLLWEFRVQHRRLFPHAPKWSPAHTWSIRALRFVKKQRRYECSRPLPDLQHGH